MVAVATIVGPMALVALVALVALFTTTFRVEDGRMAEKKKEKMRTLARRKTQQTKTVFWAGRDCGWATFLLGYECDNTGGPLFGAEKTLIGLEGVRGRICTKNVSETLTFSLEFGIER